LALSMRLPLLESAFERWQGSAASSAQLALDESPFARCQVPSRRSWVVRRTPASGAKPKSAQPRNDCLIGTSDQAGQHGGIEGGVQLEQLVLGCGPWHARTRSRGLRRQPEHELVGPTPNRFGRPSQESGDVVEIPRLEESAEEVIVLRPPAARVRREPELARAGRDRRGASLREGSCDLFAGQTVCVAVADGCVLGRGPPAPRRWTMNADSARVESKRIGRPSELDGQCFDITAGVPARAKDRVVLVAVARGGSTGQPELSTTRANALNRTAEAGSELGGRDACLAGEAQKRILEL
jgi:hypothetical protein